MERLRIKYCNGCGRKIQETETQKNEDYLEVQKCWGYFSEKDGEEHSFCLCEQCYEKILRQFVLPVSVKEYL